MVFNRAEVRLTGEEKRFRTRGESGGEVERSYCAACGSPLSTAPLRWDTIIGLFAGSLDDPSRYQPTLDIWTESAQPWDVLAESTRKFPKAPVRSRPLEP